MKGIVRKTKTTTNRNNLTKVTKLWSTMGSLIDAQFATRCRHRRAGSNRSLSSRDPFRSIRAVSVSLERRQCEKPRENDVVLFRLSLLLRNHSTHRQDSAREQHSVDSQPEEAHTAHSLSQNPKKVASVSL